MAAQIWLGEVDEFRFQEDKPPARLPVGDQALRHPAVHRPGRYSQQLGGFQNAQELYRPIILNCRHIPSNLACIVFSKLQLDLTPSQFPPSFPSAHGPKPLRNGTALTNSSNPDHPFIVMYPCRQCRLSTYVSIRQISMRTLCRCLHTLHVYTCG